MDILFYISVVSVVLIIAISGMQKDYILLFIFLLILLYEYVPIVLYFNLSSESFIRIPLGWSYLDVASDALINNYSLRLLLFVFAIACGHYGSRLLVGWQTRILTRPERLHLEHVGALSLLISLLGIVSFGTDAGGEFALVYEGGVEIEEVRRQVHPFFWYGRVTFTFVAGAAAILIYQGRYRSAAVMVMASVPLLLEFFEAGRRQAFAGAAVFVALTLLYSRNGFHRKVVFPVVVALFIAFSSAQVLFRWEEQIQDRGWNELEKATLPLTAEFVATGAVSIRGNFWVQQRGSDGGLTLLARFYNAIPFFEFDTGFASAFYKMADWAWIAPRGGGSMFVEVLVSGGLVGIFVFGILTGIVTRVGHQMFEAAAVADFRIGVWRLMGLVAISVFVMSYRNGYGSALNQSVQLTIIGSVLGLATALARRTVRR